MVVAESLVVKLMTGSQFLLEQRIRQCKMFHTSFYFLAAK